MENRDRWIDTKVQALHHSPVVDVAECSLCWSPYLTLEFLLAVQIQCQACVKCKDKDVSLFVTAAITWAELQKAVYSYHVKRLSYTM